MTNTAILSTHRTDKGRFQLFGDTVNTASRMESNGMKGRIHCSADTAKILPDRWLTMRENKIIAKGKGEMTTYFISKGASAKSIANSVAFTEGDACTTDEDNDDDNESGTNNNMDKSNWTNMDKSNWTNYTGMSTSQPNHSEAPAPLESLPKQVHVENSLTAQSNTATYRRPSGPFRRPSGPFESELSC